MPIGRLEIQNSAAPLNRFGGFTLFLVVLLVAVNAFCGGSGLNTVVVINTNSPNSLDLANYYCERRQIPAENILRTGWTGDNKTWDVSAFQTNLVQPLLDMLNQRQLTNQISYVVLSMDFPFQTINGSTVNSTTASLYYGPKSGFNGGTTMGNSYVLTDGIFEQGKPNTAPGYSFLTTMITGNSLTQAKQIVDQGVNGDATYPLQPVVLAKTSDSLRNVRFGAFDNAMFNLRIRGNYSIQRTNSDSCWGFSKLLGFQTGLTYMNFSPATFLPGAIADTMTSYAGLIFGQSQGLSLLSFIDAGAAGSYGTVTEPGSDPSKFPDPHDYFYQARGYSLAEAYYQSIAVPYMGLIVGEPLAAPFLRRGFSSWNLPPTNAILSGTVPLSARFIASDAAHPLQQIDLFVDGKFSRTLTNVAPRAGDSITVTLNGIPVSYVIPTNASLTSISAGMTAQLNDPAISNITKTAAYQHGDRIELHSVTSNRVAEVSMLSDPLLTTGGRYYRVHYLSQEATPTLASVGRDPSGAYRLRSQSPAGTPLVIEGSTDLHTWQPVATNLAGGAYDFLDAGSLGMPKRFYRVNHPVPDIRPLLSVSPGGPAANVHVASQSTLPYLVQTSTDMQDWSPFRTNLPGGTLDFTNLISDGRSRFFRAQVLTPAMPKLTVVNPTTFQIENATQPYTIEVSTNTIQWAPLTTNWDPGAVTITTASTSGAGAPATSFVSTPRDGLLESIAQGYRSYSINGIYSVGSWFQLVVTKVSGAIVSVAVTNNGAAPGLLDLAQQLATAVNTCPDLQGPDGVIMDSVSLDVYGSASFLVTARTGGFAASKTQVQFIGSQRLVPRPLTAVPLNSNLGDLQPRGHLYFTCGAKNLVSDFNLDTTRLPDGYHELTAVAYEGSNVRCQTLSTLPLTVRNTALNASFTLLDLGPTNSVSGTYHIRLSTAAPNVTALRLFANGGQLDVVSNQSSATFTVNPSTLGAGAIPFYGLVQTSTGQQFRTASQTIRFVRP